MGGIGNTTLATVLYDRISQQYNGRCFIDDVSKIYRDLWHKWCSKRAPSSNSK